jgi:membrane protease subunit HflC
MNQSRIGQILSRAMIATVAILGFLAYGCYYSVTEGQAVIVTRFGRPLAVRTAPGPYWRLPAPIEQVHLIDLRKRISESPESTTYTKDRKGVVLSTFIIWRVTEPLQFLKALGTAENAESRISGIVAGIKNEEISRFTLSALVSTDSDQLRAREIEESIRSRCDTIVRERFGVAVVEVGFQRISLPRENIAAVLERMQSERETEAARLRGEGARVAQKIRDDAHVKSQETLRRAREEAGQIHADAERKVAESYGRAYAANPDFYRFWTSVQASKRALGENSVLVLRSDRALFEAVLPPKPSRDTQQAESDTLQTGTRNRSASPGLKAGGDE